MSKAFTKEDDLPDPVTPRRLPSPLPPGAKNYITPAGAERLKEELDRLIDEERPRAAAAAAAANAVTTDPGAADRLRTLDARIDQLRTSLQSAVVVGPPEEDVAVVRFGAWVSVRDERGEELRYRIVGVDEADADRGWISWVSPIARALLSARSGDSVRIALPSGEKDLEILDVVYASPETR